MTDQPFKVLVVGGGAGGLELACKLGRKWGPDRVALVDANLFHIWKPSLHEVAAGTLDIHQEGLSYQMLAHDNGFSFHFGPMTGLDTAAHQVVVGAVADGAEEVLPERRIDYESLVLAIGSVSNDFGVPGVADHAFSLDGPHDAERFRLRMLQLLSLVDVRKSHDPNAAIDIVIIGGGATGVELAAELREATALHAQYGLRHIEAGRDVRIRILEGAPRLLAPLDEKVSAAATHLLKQRHVEVTTSCRVVKISWNQVTDADGHVYPADLCVWAAGIKAPPLLAQLGLPVQRSGQVTVDGRLRVEGVPDVFALGDCAWCPQPDGKSVPPRAQSAHQQADYLCGLLQLPPGTDLGKRPPYLYHDHGSLVSVGSSATVGSLMGNLFRSTTWFVEGLFARMVYVSLHLMHHRAVMGTLRTAVLAMARFLVKRTRPLVKLH
ncbi:MAG TPA: NAD(P)/FAD-dependent oxidoreductase [Burkholderiaceae bacterium]|jgi:NADH dehydrogenase|nr:NAD(P)/FAD-dependent oxidoreductase [Burkholderiaceae bacterium]